MPTPIEVYEIEETDAEIKALEDANTALQEEFDAYKEAHPDTGPEPIPPEPPVTGKKVLHGSSSEGKSPNNTAQKAYESLEAMLVAQSGQSGPVLMFDHRYNGDTIDTAIPSWWAGKGLKFGMLNGKGPLNPNSSAFSNLRPLARSLPAGFTLYLNWWHEPEDNFPASQWVPAFAGFVAAVKAIPASEFKNGAKIVPCFNLHGSMFRKGTSMYEKWGPLADWNPYPAIPSGDRGLVVGTINGYADPASTTKGQGEDPAWCFGSGFAEMRKWGATRLGIGEWGAQPANPQAGYVKLAGPYLEEQGDVEVAAYFSSGVGGNAGTEGWSLKSDAALAEYAKVCLNGRRS